MYFHLCCNSFEVYEMTVPICTVLEYIFYIWVHLTFNILQSSSEWLTVTKVGGAIVLAQLYNPDKYYPDLHFESRHQNDPNLERSPKRLRYY